MIHLFIDQDKLYKAYQADKTKQVELTYDSIPEKVRELQKGWTQTKLTCINCPRGCKIHVICNEKNEIEEISGNTCKRGENYAR